MLALVHISSRHFVPDILAEAQEAFPRPSPRATSTWSRSRCPERGGPELVQNGAREPRTREARTGADDRPTR